MSNRNQNIAAFSTKNEDAISEVVEHIVFGLSFPGARRAIERLSDRFNAESATYRGAVTDLFNETKDAIIGATPCLGGHAQDIPTPSEDKTETKDKPKADNTKARVIKPAPDKTETTKTEPAKPFSVKVGDNKSFCALCAKPKSKKNKVEQWQYPGATLMVDDKAWNDSGLGDLIGHYMCSDCRTKAGRAASQLSGAFIKAHPEHNPELTRLRKDLSDKQAARDAAITERKTASAAVEAVKKLPDSNPVKVLAGKSLADAEAKIVLFDKAIGAITETLKKEFSVTA